MFNQISQSMIDFVKEYGTSQHISSICMNQETLHKLMEHTTVDKYTANNMPEGVHAYIFGVNVILNSYLDDYQVGMFDANGNLVKMIVLEKEEFKIGD